MPSSGDHSYPLLAANRLHTHPNQTSVFYDENCPSEKERTKGPLGILIIWEDEMSFWKLSLFSLFRGHVDFRRGGGGNMVT